MALSNFQYYSLQNKVRVHPIVFYHIVDAYERRYKNATCAIGTLLGFKNEDGRLEITNAFTVTHKEDDGNIELDSSYAASMYELNVAVYPDEKIVGWFTTGKTILKCARKLYDHYLAECEDPIYLLMDPTLRSLRLNMHLFCVVNVGLPGRSLGIMFTPVPLDLECTQLEQVALKYMQKHAMQSSRQMNTMLPDLVHVVALTREMQLKLDLMLRYINDVLQRRRRPDNDVGRELYDVLTSVPPVNPEEFNTMFISYSRDMLLCISLASMVKTQVLLNEKLCYLDDN